MRAFVDKHLNLLSTTKWLNGEQVANVVDTGSSASDQRGLGLGQRRRLQQRIVDIRVG
jgi:hypothetical protein